MNKRHFVLALIVCLALLVSACAGGVGKSGAATGGAPRTPFIGGVAGLTINFEKDSPPPEVTDDETFGFKAILRLKNDGETNVEKNNVRVNLIGFDPEDFSATLEDIREQLPEDDLEAKKRDAEGNLIEGATTFASFPKSNDDFIPRKFSGNTEFIFRAEVCYTYQTKANTKMCILRDMINIRDNSLCRPIFVQSKAVYSSSAPVQVVNFRQSVIGKDKLSFSFDISLSGNVDIFRDKTDVTPASGFDSACPKDPRRRRELENKVKVEVNTVPPSDPIIQSMRCGGLEGGNIGIVTLVNGLRTITCTVDLNSDRIDLEKVVEIKMDYNVLDNRETRVLVKHLAGIS